MKPSKKYTAVVWPINVPSIYVIVKADSREVLSIPKGNEPVNPATAKFPPIGNDVSVPQPVVFVNERAARLFWRQWCQWHGHLLTRVSLPGQSGLVPNDDNPPPLIEIALCDINPTASITVADARKVNL